jgi:plastocyanin
MSHHAESMRARVRAQSRTLWVVVAAAAILWPRYAEAQSLLDRPPDMGGTWVGSLGTIYFDFSHRFRSTGPPARKVVNSPTFLLGAALPGRVLIGARYASNSIQVPGYPNEWEFFGRYNALNQTAGAPLDATVHGGYNQAARSWDGEAEIARRIGPLRLLVAGRGFSNFHRTGARWALAGGAVIRLQRFVALAADAATLVDRRAGEPIAWGAGLQLQIPYTPHTLSIQLSNTNTTTLEGASLGSGEGHRWGFEFTIPLTLSRYFGGRHPSGPGPQAGEAGIPANVAAVVLLTDELRYVPDTVRIRVGQAVLWRSVSSLIHTVTADPSKAARADDVLLPNGASPFDSGDIKPNAVFSHTFDVPGEYRYFCTPHELGGMVAVVVVEK